MSISTENTSLEQLTQLEAFFDAIRNPDKFKKLIDEAKAVVAAQAAVIGPYTTVLLANDFLAKSKVQIEEAKADIKKGYDELDSKEETFEQYKKEKEDSLALKTKMLEDRSAMLETQGNQVVEQAKVLSEQAQALDKRTATLSSLMEALQIKDKELQEKAEKLKALLGS